MHVYDGFESSYLSRLRWTDRRFEPGAVVFEGSVVRSGHRALAITVHSGHRPEAASQSGGTERDELMESWWLFSRTRRTYVYSFSLYLPTNFPQTRERLVIAPWRQLCEGSPCIPDNPILAVRYEIGRLQITRNDEYGKTLLYQGNEDVGASGSTYAWLRDGTARVREPSMQPFKDGKLSITKDPQSNSLAPVTRGTP